MRGFILPLAVLAAALPTVARADDSCPPKITPELLTALGDPITTLPGGQAIYQPAGATMMGMPVSYVVVTKGSGSAIEEIDYRFAGQMRKYSEHFPMPVLQAFDKAYSGNCSSGRVTSCAAGFPSKVAGDLATAGINEAYIDLPAKAQGAGAAMVKADFSSQSQGPVFLVCQYN